MGLVSSPLEKGGKSCRQDKALCMLYHSNMCGIFGFLGSTFEFNGISSVIEEHISHLQSRGPDGSGEYKTDSWYLGHTRLSIQDLSSECKQPFWSKSKKSVLSFNGELYNKSELKEMLNLEWSTNSDTEVLVELIEAKGIDALTSVRGMFAFCFIDLEKNRAYLARDLFGEKPLHYFTVNGCLVFSSQPYHLFKLLHKNLNHSQTLNSESLGHFIKYGYLPSVSGVYGEVKSLLPSEILEVNLVDSKCKSRRFKVENKIDFGSLGDAISQSVKESLLSDAPLGIMLSGGIDSSIIYYECLRAGVSLPAFVLDMPNNSNDVHYAKLLCSHFGTTKDLRIIKVDPSEAGKTILRVLKDSPFPLGDSALISLFLLSDFAKKEVKVLLSGDGGDEIFGGYEYYPKYFMRELNVYEQSQEFKRLLFGVLRKEVSVRRKVELLVTTANAIWFSRSIEKNYNKEHAAISEAEMKRILLNPQIIKKSFTGNPNLEGFEEILRLDLDSYLPLDLLVKSDIGGMMNGVEVRAPFLNPNVFSHVKFSSRPELLSGKVELKAEYKGKIPDAIFERRKRGFGVPMKDWLKLENVSIEIDNLFSDKGRLIFEYFDREGCRQLAKENHVLLWNLLALSLWLDRNVI